MSVSQVHFRGLILDTGRVKVDKIYMHTKPLKHTINNGLLQKKTNRGVEDMEFPGVLEKKECGNCKGH